MPYYLGIDLGTTYTAAAVWRDGRVEVANLGNRAPVVPSVLFLRDEGELVVGEAAERRAETDPEHVVREFKRRTGDPTPIIVGGTPYGADLLTAKLLRWVVDKVAEAEGEPAAGIAVTHPANWGTFKTDVLTQAIRQAEIGPAAGQTGAVLVTEPEAAAIHYASRERVSPESTVAVYDLGGGTFDAAVLRRSEAGWDILGVPEGLERLGGVDFDAAVLDHVLRTTGVGADDLDRHHDPASLAAMARLRQDCVAAKEALSADTDVSIPVLLPGLRTQVRLTRAELEDVIRPALRESMMALNRAIRSAGLEPTDVDKVLLVGGSSRVPLVAQLVSSELGRPVAIDAHPKHGVALGAALIAAERGTSTQPPPAPTAAPLAVPPPPPPPPAPAPQPPQVPEPKPHSNMPALLGILGVVVAMVVLAILVITSFDGSGNGNDRDDTIAASQTGEGTSPETAKEASRETADNPFEESDTTAIDVDDNGDGGDVNLLTGDPGPAFDSFATLHDGNPRVLEITLYETYAFIAVQVPGETEFIDRYMWEDGQLGEPDDWSAFLTDQSDLFEFSAVNPDLIPNMVTQAQAEITGDGYEVSHIIVDNTFTADGQPEVRVYISNPDRPSSGGYASFTLDGTPSEVYQ